MSATTLQADIIAELDSATSAGRRLYYGQRLQTSSLPALTFEVQSGAAAALGNNNRLCVYEVTFNAISDAIADAMTLDTEIRDTLQLALSFTSICTQLGTVQEPQPENGDEAGLYIVTSQYTFYQAI